jgi:hypothetical protein
MQIGNGGKNIYLNSIICYQVGTCYDFDCIVTVQDCTMGLESSICTDVVYTACMLTEAVMWFLLDLSYLYLADALHVICVHFK